MMDDMSELYHLHIVRLDGRSFADEVLAPKESGALDHLHDALRFCAEAGLFVRLNANEDDWKKWNARLREESRA